MVLEADAVDPPPAPGTCTHGKAPAGLQDAGRECVFPTDPLSPALKAHDAVDDVGDTHSPRGRGSIGDALP